MSGLDKWKTEEQEAFEAQPVHGPEIYNLQEEVLGRVLEMNLLDCLPELHGVFRTRHLEALKRFIEKEVEDALTQGYQGAVKIYEKAGKNDKKLIKQLIEVIEGYEAQLKRK